MKLVFELVVADVNVSAELEKQKRLVKDLTAELKKTDVGSEKFEQIANALAKARVGVSDLTQKQKDLNREFKATQVPTDSLAGLRLEYSKLTDQLSKLTKAERESGLGLAIKERANSLKNEINGIQESVGNFTGSVGNYQKALISTFDIVTAGLVTGGISRGIEIVADTVAKGVKAFADYEAALDNLSSLTGKTGAELEKFKKQAESLTTIRIGDEQIVNSVTNIVEAFKSVGGARPELLEDADALAEVTKQAIVLSKASGLDLNASVEALTTGLGQFQLEATASKDIINELAAGAKAGASEIPDTTAALKDFGTTAASSNIKTSESIALIQTLADRQLKGAEAGTQLRNILAKLASADVLPRTALAELKEAGVNIDVLRDKSLPLEVRLTELGKLSGNTTALVKAFGVENLAASQILAEGTDKYKDFLKQIQGTNEAYRQAETNAGNLKTEYENLKQEGLNALVTGFEALAPLLSFVVSLFSSLLRGVVGFVSALSSLPKFIKENEVAFGALITGLTLLNGEMIFASANSLRLAVAEKGRAAVTYLVTGAQNLLNVAMKANPIGLIISAVAALILGYEALYDRSEKFRASISGIGAFAKELFSIIGESVTAFLDGFKRVADGDIQGALSSFGKAFVVANPIGIAFTQGKRLRDAFNNGYNDKLASDQREKAEQERDDRQLIREEKKAKKVKDINTTLSDALNRDAKKQEKGREDAINSQIKRIAELRKSIRDLDAGTILNDFDRQSVEIENKRADALNKLGESREELTKKIASQKGILTDADKQELALISEQTASITAEYDNQQKEVEKKRTAAVDKQKRELISLYGELNVLAKANAEKLAQAQSELINADFGAKQIELQKALSDRKKALLEQLADQSISEKTYKEEYVKAQELFNIGTLKLEKERLSEVTKVAKELELVRVEAAKASLATRLSAIEAELNAEKARLSELKATQGIDTTDQVQAAEQKAIEQAKAAQIDYNKTVRDAAKDSEKAQIEGINAVNEADENALKDKIARLNIEKEKRKELTNTLIDTAKTISSALFEIERNRIDQSLEKSVTALDSEFAKKRELAAGNQFQLEQLDVQYQKRKEALEKEAAEKRKKTARTEAIIQGALAVVKALPNLVLAGAAFIATAAQVAIINSQKFEHGGVAKFGKSGYFGGRPHSQGGTKGRFSDGTEVEVEKDELFIIMNKRASAAIRNMSDFNYAHGGRKFETGGSLDFTPQIAIPGESSQMIIVSKATFTDEQVAMFARTVATETANSTKRAVATGLDDRNRTAEREVIREQNSQI